jgi:hypothetical protein|tara:strand:- start:551 stop:1132 length:582 start_codon:yes stop_codon:yes gene_type:complete
MANVNKPFGLRPLGNLSATGSQKQYGYLINDNQTGAIFQGDLVTIDNGYLVKFNNTDHTCAVGVFNGCQYIDPTTGKPTWKNYYPGSVNITSGSIVADVIDDPSQLFLIQNAGTPTQASIGLNAEITASTTGSTTTGVSNMSMSGTFTETAATNLKAVGLWNVPGNEMGQYAILVVKINEHMYGSTGTPGFST